MRIGVSSFSLRSRIGPVTFERFDERGRRKNVTLDAPQTLSFPQFFRGVGNFSGVDYVEVCQVQLDSLDRRYLAEIRAGLDDANLELLTVPIDDGDISHPLQHVRELSMARTVRWFDAAAELGAHYARVNVISGLESAGKAASRSVTVQAMHRLADAAEQRGLRLLVENKGGTRRYPEILLELLQAVGHQRVGLILDTGNIEPLASAMISELVSGTPAIGDLELDRVYEAISLMAPFAAVVHAKSHRFDSAGNQGPVDLARALGIIRDAGFDGPITIEYEGGQGDPWENTDRTVELVRRSFTDGGASAPSHAGTDLQG